MSTDTTAAVAGKTALAGTQTQAANSQWFETALTILFTAAAVLFVSFIAVVTGLV